MSGNRNPFGQALLRRYGKINVLFRTRTDINKLKRIRRGKVKQA